MQSRGRYRLWLKRANDIDCLTLIWAVWALQSGNEKAGRNYIKFPPQAVTKDMVGEYAIYKWELETLVTSLLTTPKDKPRDGKYRYTNLTTFDSLSQEINNLRQLEGYEYALTGTAENIWEEMYRLCQRQFRWQRGYNSEQLYRYAYVYGQGECGAFFEEQNGISVSTFMQLSLAMFGLTMQKPWQVSPGDAVTKVLKLPQSDLDKTLALHSIEIGEARAKAKAMNDDAVARLKAPLKTAYMPSVLRQSSMIRTARDGQTIYCAPLPTLVMNRATAALYYDIRQGPDKLITEANARFEAYICKLVEAYHPRLTAFKGERYGPSKATEIDAPDLSCQGRRAGHRGNRVQGHKAYFRGSVRRRPDDRSKKRIRAVGQRHLPALEVLLPCAARHLQSPYGCARRIWNRPNHG